MDTNSKWMIGSGAMYAWVRSVDGTINRIGAIMSANGSAAFDTVSIPGDDILQGEFNSNQKQELSYSANAFTFAAYAAISGNPVTFTAATTGGSPTPAYKKVGGGTLSENSPPYVELGIVTQGKDDQKKNGHFVKIYHSVQCKPISTPQENNTAFQMNFDATAYPTAKNIIGQTLESQRIWSAFFMDGPFDVNSAVIFPTV